MPGKHSLLIVLEVCRKVFPKRPIISFKFCKNFQNILVRAKLYGMGEGDVNERGYTLCGKFRCEVCDMICDSNTFRFYHISYHILHI